MFFGKNEKYKEVADLLYTAGTIGLNLVSATFVGLGMGWLADKYIEEWFGVTTKPWGLLFMLVMGIIAGFRMVYDEARRIMRVTSKEGHPGAGNKEAEKGKDEGDNGKRR